MKFLLAVLSVFAAAALVGGAALFVWAQARYTGPGPLDHAIAFTVEKGDGVARIAENLSYQGAFGDAVLDDLIFKAAARLSGRQSSLQAGEYEFPSGISMEQILDKLARGDVIRRRITVPEGLTVWQIVKILDQTPELEGTVDTIPEEGRLLPETYQYTRGETRADKVAQMRAAMDNILGELWKTRPADSLMMSEAEALILASVVEKETGVASERARIAGVFLNRLRLGMPLQSDPTVIYAITGGRIQDEGMGPLGRRLLKKDLEFDSPYNTYKYPGLPPGPICNPGRDAIAAVINPEKHDYIYFVADGTGGHVFARTVEEHNRNVAEWRRVRKSAGN